MISASAAFATTVLATTFLLYVLHHEQIVDLPSARSSHGHPTLRGGGLAVVLGGLAGVGVAGSELEPRFGVGLMIAAWCFGAIGLIDDVSRGLGVVIRLGLQTAVAVGSLLFLLEGLGGTMAWKVALAIGVVLWLVAFVNGFNFMDGVNGIAALQTIAAGTVFALLGVYSDVGVLEFGGIAIAAAALGFLPFNFPRARIFLGDVGSYAIGAWLAILAVIGLRADLPPEALFAPLAVCVADTATTLGRRVARRERWWEAHREHTYQRLVDAGWQQLNVSITVFACVVACSALGALSLSDNVFARELGDLGIMVVVVAYLLLPRVAGSPVASRREPAHM
jgi:UDP-N-acetylmuramyl pentapeptide phosphotransferase/UDP-N-acetylglucosamine-1-phosphate transferase